MRESGEAKGPSNLQVGCLKHWHHPAALAVPPFTKGEERERPWNTFSPPTRSAVAGFFWPLLGIWKSLGN